MRLTYDVQFYHKALLCRGKKGIMTTRNELATWQKVPFSRL